MRLLQKTIRGYFIYSLFILLAAIPIFYFSLLRIIMEDIDEDLYSSKEQIISRFKSVKGSNRNAQFQLLDHDVEISQSNNARSYDTLYTINILDTLFSEVVPHRVLAANFRMDKDYYLLHIRASLLDYDNLIQTILVTEVGILLLLFLGLQLINRNLNKNIWEPFYLTLDKLKSHRVEADTQLILPVSSIKEFEDLNKTIEKLTERNHKAYIIQKEFAENASHEIQTPLAILQSKLELLMQTVPLNEQQAKLVDELADATQRMVRLNKSLLLLTKIDNNQFSGQELISLVNILAKFKAHYALQLSQKEIEIQMVLLEDVSLMANKALMEMLVSNLLGNAIRHNYPGGVISIILEPGKLSIQNSGKATPLDELKIFKRFAKDSSDSNSMGLGLEIVSKICKMYNFQLEYTFLNSIHIFTVGFIKPAAILPG